jgi:hypothetical protein
MCGSPAPKDNSVQLRQMEIAEENRRREEEAKALAEKRTQFGTKVGSAFDTATEDARADLGSRGLDEAEFLPIIMRALQGARGGIPEFDPNPLSYFTGAAGGALTSERDRRRSKFTNDIDKFAPFNFADMRIGNTMDDDLITGMVGDDYNRAILEAQRQKDRGVLTDAGYTGAMQNIDRQRPGINARLQDTGGGLLEEGRQTLRNRANAGRQGASMYELGQQFSPLDTQNMIDQDFTNFRTTLADRLKAKVGTSPLFDTSDLLNVGGAAQGALNTKNIGDLLVQKPDEEEVARGLGTVGAF